MDAALWAEIRRLCLREGLAQREAARRLGVDPKTIRKALRMERFDPARKAAPRGSKLDPFKQEVRALLVRHPDLSAVRMAAEIRRAGYQGSLTVLKDFVRTIRPRTPPEAFLRLCFAPGDAAQVDWTSCGTLNVEGKARRVSAFLFVLCHSRLLYVEFTLCEQLEIFLECHERAFLALQGVPRRVIYDNLRSVVLAHVEAEVRLNSRFLDFSSHYGFNPVACTPRRPQEKGRVENSAKYLKQSFLLGRQFVDLDAMNRAVRVWLDEVANVREHQTTHRRPVDLFAEEKGLLGPLPAAGYDTRIVRTVKASPLCRVHFEGNTYSVPPACAGAVLTLKATQREVCVYAQALEIARHARAQGRHVDVVDPAHVAALLERKRRAERGALVQRFASLGEAAEAYLKGLVRAEIALYRHLRRILLLVDRFGRDEVLSALAHAQDFGAFGADYVERILVEARRRAKGAPPLGPLSLPRSPDLERITLEEIDLSLYDKVFGTGDCDEQARRPPPQPTQGEPPTTGPAPDGGDLPGGDPEGDEGGSLVPRDAGPPRGGGGAGAL